MEIKASDIKLLREKTGAGVLDCKKALEENQGDFAKAEELLKKQGMAAVEKRADRVAKEGKVFIKTDKSRGAAIELSCETDFVSRNIDFISCGNKILDLAFSKGLKEKTAELENVIRDLATILKENISLKHLGLIEAGQDGVVHEYIHGDGKIGVIVKFTAEKKETLENEKVKAFIHDIALHVAAFNPAFIDRTKVPAEYIAKQDELFKTQVAEDEKLKEKPANVIEGILKGKMNKHLADICLFDQGFIKEEKQSVRKIMETIMKETAATFTIADFLCFRVGE